MRRSRRQVRCIRRPSRTSYGTSFTRSIPPRGLTMHVCRSLCFRMGYRPGHETAPQLVLTASRQPVRRASVPRSVIFPRNSGPSASPNASGWRTLVQLPRPRCPPSSLAGLPTAKLRRVAGPSPRLTFECILCLTGTPRPFSAERRTIFCTGPGIELCVVAPCQAPVPPRRIAMRCSRCGTGNHRTGFRGGDE